MSKNENHFLKFSIFVILYFSKIIFGHVTIIFYGFNVYNKRRKPR